MTTDHKELCERLYCEGALTAAYGCEDISRLCSDAMTFIESQAKQIAGHIEQHARDSAELRRLCAERDEAKRDAKSWKEHSGICNQANERMQDAAYEAGCPDEIDVADWILQTIEDKSEIIAALRKALAYWMPRVFDERSADDAYLLVGYEGEIEPECWGDSMTARIAELEAQLEQRVSLRDMCHALTCADISMPECRLALRVTGVPPSPEEFEDAVRAAILANKGEWG